jgi:hypothetical protein
MDPEFEMVVRVVRIAVRFVFLEIAGSGHDRVDQFILRFRTQAAVSRLQGCRTSVHRSISIWRAPRISEQGTRRSNGQ